MARQYLYLNGQQIPLNGQDFWVGTHEQFESANPPIPKGTLLYFTDGDTESLKLTEVSLPFTPPNDGLLICHMENGGSGTARLTVNNGKHNINLDSTGARHSMTVPVFKGLEAKATTSGNVYNTKYYFFGAM